MHIIKAFIILLVIVVIVFLLPNNVWTWVLFSNKNYAGKIDIETSIVSEAQLPEAFLQQQQTRNMLPLREGDAYLVIRLINQGKTYAWGTIRGTIENYPYPLSIEVCGLGGGVIRLKVMGDRVHLTGRAITMLEGVWKI